MSMLTVGVIKSDRLTWGLRAHVVAGASHAAVALANLHGRERDSWDLRRGLTGFARQTCSRCCNASLRCSLQSNIYFTSPLEDEISGEAQFSGRSISA
jgi:hypothetical protein